ncbi:MAG TPA: response regulator, partial [Phnomibacter sp.]|nr:response regulator [Phnomibacter sp.]
LQYVIVEDITDVARRLQHEMEAYAQWAYSGHAQSVRDAKMIIEQKRPQLIFCDWDLVGGSGFEVLQFIQQQPGYQPFIIFNTGFQSDHPEIAEELINTYKPDAFINKPYWQKLLEHLPSLLTRAQLKASSLQVIPFVWLKAENGQRHRIDAKSITSILQCPQNPRNKLVYLWGQPQPIACTLTWKEAVELMEQSGDAIFAVNRRYAIINKAHVHRFQNPYVWVGNPQIKLEVVKENVREFEKWIREE